MRAVVALVASWLCLHGTAFACSYSPPQFFEIEADESDQDAPPPPDATIERVKRGKEPERDGCSWHESSCDDIGYVFEIRGTHPAGLDALANRPLTSTSYEPGKLLLTWNDGVGHQNYDFDIYIWSVDRAGNMSESPTKLHVDNDGSDGCAALASRSHGQVVPLLLVLWLWRVRRRAERRDVRSLTAHRELQRAFARVRRQRQ